jgi:hypothetical protein
MPGPERRREQTVEEENEDEDALDDRAKCVSQGGGPDTRGNDDWCNDKGEDANSACRRAFPLGPEFHCGPGEPRILRGLPSPKPANNAKLVSESQGLVGRGG